MSVSITASVYYSHSDRGIALDLIVYNVHSFMWYMEVKITFMLIAWNLLIVCFYRSLYRGCWSVLSPQLPLSHCQHNWRELLPAILLPGQWGVWGGPGVYQHHQGKMQPHQTARTVSDWRKMSGPAWYAAVNDKPHSQHKSVPSLQLQMHYREGSSNLHIILVYLVTDTTFNIYSCAFK